MKKIWWITAAAGGAAVAAAFGRGRSAPRVVGAAPSSLTPRYRGGEGPPLLLLHGVGGNWRVWSPIIPLLEPHHDVLAPTLLGHGGATGLADGVAPTLDALVDGVEAELERAGIETAHVVGNSLGGWVAIELARRGRAQSLILFSPAGARTSQRRMAAVAAGLRLSIEVLGRLAAHADRIAGSARLRHALMALQASCTPTSTATST
ncbi:MAG: alpha/beta fold hydrolase [Pseudonocardia sp.]|nr:alpha/beta fold hydrolase [Pseudonocardia sp.]